MVDTESGKGFPFIPTSFVEVTREVGAKHRVFFKNELEQPSGSFKLRGIGYLVGTSLTEAQKLGKSGAEVFSSSGGNAGVAAAYASKFYGVPCTVVLPVTSNALFVRKLKELDAKVIIYGKHWGEADEYLRETVIKGLPSSIYPVYCHPFDNSVVWDGHSTLIDEIVTGQQLSDEELKKIKAVVCSVGGGGLYNGIVIGLERNSVKEKLGEVPVIAIETKGAPTFHEAVKNGKSVHLSEVKTVATSLASPYIAEQSLTFFQNSQHKTFLELIDDKDAMNGTLDFYDTFEGKLIEPACGAAVSTVFQRKDILDKYDLKEDDIVVVVVCGGITTEELIKEYRAKVQEEAN